MEEAQRSSSYDGVVCLNYMHIMYNSIWLERYRYFYKLLGIQCEQYFCIEMRTILAFTIHSVDGNRANKVKVHGPLLNQHVYIQRCLEKQKYAVWNANLWMK